MCSFQRSSSPGPRAAFTLIELLVVIAVIGLLVAISMPAIQGVRESSRKTECLDRLHQLAVALQHHDATFSQLPKDNDRGWGIFPFLLPELEQRPLYEQLGVSTTMRSGLTPQQQQFLKTGLEVLWCPSYPDVDESLPSGETRTTYLGVSGLFSKRMTLSDIIDGESQTMAFGETTSNQEWSAPGLGSSGSGPNQGSFASHHAGGVQIVLCDGQARFISENVDAATFTALCTPQGRDIVGPY